ncbi:hypothetical protein CXF72_11230 [Psychromonas sp. MB-3u-54]|uniref:hypothetical protein n=1 Tax=Psychromonas sp. MB-3u-54 TaxID=2058319 RepID=UPI000C34B124|nr:hypothetical protein [Psychromonas sp. MB-3u-54]PKH02514.1 hypothetical protein CXF72_11230 [Psychromonas sp. MB-3u-54]
MDINIFIDIKNTEALCDRVALIIYDFFGMEKGKQKITEFLIKDIKQIKKMSFEQKSNEGGNYSSDLIVTKYKNGSDSCIYQGRGVVEKFNEYDSSKTSPVCKFNLNQNFQINGTFKKTLPNHSRQNYWLTCEFDNGNQIGEIVIYKRDYVNNRDLKCITISNSYNFKIKSGNVCFSKDYFIETFPQYLTSKDCAVFSFSNHKVNYPNEPIEMMYNTKIKGEDNKNIIYVGKEYLDKTGDDEVIKKIVKDRFLKALSGKDSEIIKNINEALVDISRQTEFL